MLNIAKLIKNNNQIIFKKPIKNLYVCASIQIF